MWHATSQLIIQCCTIKTKPIKYATHSISPLTVKSAHPGDNISNSAASSVAPPPLFLAFHFVSSLEFPFDLHSHFASNCLIWKLDIYIFCFFLLFSMYHKYKCIWKTHWQVKKKKINLCHPYHPYVYVVFLVFVLKSKLYAVMHFSANGINDRGRNPLRMN